MAKKAATKKAEAPAPAPTPEIAATTQAPEAPVYAKPVAVIKGKERPKMLRVRCIRDCAQDAPYHYFKAGHEYTILSNSPVLVHFQILETLSDKESDRIQDEAAAQY